MNDLVGFDFEGKRVRILRIAGKPWFVAKDIAEAMGYVNTRKAIRDHCKNAISYEKALEQAGERFVPPADAGDLDGHTTVIPLGDIYRLFARSQMPNADKFERKIFDEVLPEIHEKGVYIAPGAVVGQAVDGDLATTLELLAQQIRQKETEADAMASKMIDVAHAERDARRRTSQENAQLKSIIMRKDEDISFLNAQWEAVARHAWKVKKQTEEREEARRNMLDVRPVEQPHELDNVVIPMKKKTEDNT